MNKKEKVTKKLKPWQKQIRLKDKKAIFYRDGTFDTKLSYGEVNDILQYY